MKKEPEQQVDDDERYCDNEKCPYASYICFEELEKYRGKPWVCAKCVDEDEDEEEQTDEDGREYLYYLTYGGGPCGGYMVYTDNNAVYSWHFEFGFDKRRLTRLHNQKLIMRRDPGMPSNYEYAQGFQVRVVEE